MQSTSATRSRYSFKDLPDSKIRNPISFTDQIKYLFWRFYTPLHPFCRDAVLTFGLMKHSGRQGFLVGTVAPDQTIESVVSFLVDHGYGNHFVAWKDDGEVVGLRRVENFKYQFHIRIFGDGEIRGHYEYTPECHPILHMQKVGQEDRRQEFYSLLGNRILPKTE